MMSRGLLVAFLCIVAMFTLMGLRHKHGSVWFTIALLICHASIGLILVLLLMFITVRYVLAIFIKTILVTTTIVCKINAMITTIITTTGASSLSCRLIL